MITLKRADLQKSAEWAARGLSIQTPAVALKAEGGVMTMRASNYDAEVVARVECEGDMAEVFLPGAVFSNVVKAMRGTTAKIEQDGARVTVNAGSKATFSVVTEGPVRWPETDDRELTTIPSANLRKCLGWASLVSGKDTEGAAWLNGVRMYAHDGTLEFRGGNRYSAGRALLDGGPEEFDVATPALHVARFAQGLSGTVRLSERSGVLVLDDGTLSAAVRLQDQQGWPDIEKVWNPPQPVWFVADRSELLSALSTVTVGGDVVVIDASGDYLEVSSSHGLDYSKDAAADITDTVGADEVEGVFSWRFNPTLLIPALKALEGERVKLAGVAGKQSGPVMVSDWPTEGLFRTVMSMRGKDG